MADRLIAGIVTSNGGTLLTRNRGHFERIPSISLAKPYSMLIWSLRSRFA